MRNKFLLSMLIFSLFFVHSAFAFITVHDPTAIANQILQLADSGSTLANIIESTKEAIRLSQTAYRGFRKFTDSNGNVYDMASAIIEGGMDVAGSGMRFASSVSGEDLDWESFHAVNTLANTASELIQATEYNVTGESNWNTTGHFDEKTGEWVWDSDYNFKLPTVSDIRTTYKKSKFLVDKMNKQYDDKIKAIAAEKEKILKATTEAIESSKTAGEDLSSNAAIQSIIQSANIGIKSLENAEKELQIAKEQQDKELQKIADQQGAHELAASLNEEIIALNNELRIKNQRIEELNQLNEKYKRSNKNE